MEKKKLTKTLWHGKDLDEQGNPIVPEAAPDGRPMDGLNEGELFIHNNGTPSLWTVNEKGEVVPVSGGGSSIDLSKLDTRYLRKDKEDTAHKHITFEEGIDVYTLAKMVNLEVTELARIAKAFVTQIGSEKFVDGFFGEGWQIWKAIATGDWCMTIDRLTVRKVMTVFELIIQKIRSVGGMVVVSAGNGKVKEVEQVGLEYKFTFEDENTFQVNDLMRCQVWTGNDVKHYWVEVTRVDGENVYARIADFGDVVPVPGDEVVLMGNTQNKLRQGLVLISAAEDGQPRVDVLDGVKSTNFDDCLKARLGALDGITDSRFPADMQPKGYGIYGNNCYLTGVFVLSNGKDVQTQFAILEGMIRANMSSVQQQINAEDNYLSNASMTTNLMGWEFHNDVKVFRTSGGLLHFNGNFYSIKNSMAGIVPNGEMVVLRLKNSYIRQKNANFAMHPTFDLVEQTTTDENGDEVGTGVKLYRPRMFYVSFRYMVKTRGTLRVYFENEETRSDFEPYTKLDYTKVLEAGDSFAITDDTIAGKWNGTGDFYLSFDGEMFLYDLALADDPLSDMEERWSMQLEITEKKIQANAEHIIQQGEDLEEYRSEFLYTAEQLRTEFKALVQNTEKDITEEYTGLVTQTAQKLESDYNAKFGNYYGTITEEYNSKITQTAKDITTKLNAKIDATDKAVGDLEVGLKADYNAKIAASAESLTSDYEAQITNLKNGDIATMKSSIVQNANQIALKASQTSVDSLTGRVSSAEAKFDLYVLETELGDLVSKIEISADQIDLQGVSTFLVNNNSSAVKEALGEKASKDLSDAVVGGKTVIAGGYINTDVIDVDSLVAKRLSATDGSHIFNLDEDGFRIYATNNGVALGQPLVALSGNSSYGSLLQMWNRAGDRWMYLSPENFSLGGNGCSLAVDLSSMTMNLNGGLMIKNFAINPSDGTGMVGGFYVYSSTSLSMSNYSASSYKGRVFFTYFTNECTVSGLAAGSVKCKYGTLFYSNGSSWYHFSSKY